MKTLIALLLAASTAWGTTVTVCPDNSSEWCDWETVEEGLDNITADDTLRIYGGTYYEAGQLDVAADDDNIVIHCSEDSVTIFLMSSATYSMQITGDATEFLNGTWVDSSAAKYTRAHSCTSPTFRNTTWSAASGAGAYLLRIGSTGTLTADGSTFSSRPGNNNVENIWLETDGLYADFNNCTFTDIRLDINDATACDTLVIDSCTFTAPYIDGEYMVEGPKLRLDIRNTSFTLDTDDGNTCGAVLKDPAVATGCNSYIYNCTFASTLAATNAGMTYGLNFASDELPADTIHTCTFDTLSYAISISDAAADSSDGWDTYIYNNTIGYHRVIGIQWSTNGAEVIDNTITTVDTAYASACHSVVIGNDSHNNYGQGKGLDAVVSGNTIIDSPYAIVCKGTNPYIYDNYITGGGYSIYMKGSAAPYVAHNYIIDSDDAIVIGESAVQQRSYDGTVVNNLLAGNACNIRWQTTDADSGTWRIDYNAYDSATKHWVTVAADCTLTGWLAQGYDARGTTDSTAWRRYWGGDTSFVTTPPHNWYSIGRTQATSFCDVTDNFATLAVCDDSLVIPLAAWAVGDTITFSIANDANMTEYQAYEAASDSLFVNATVTWPMGWSGGHKEIYFTPQGWKGSHK